MLTVDAPVWGLRERDIRNKFHLPKGLALANLKGEEIPHRLPTGLSGSALSAFRTAWVDENIGWQDVKWLRSITRLPIVLKGIQHPEDAKLAVSAGVDALIVSNHGGRQLDGAQSSLDALPAIVGAANGKLEVLMDGGIRRGTDIFKALALGAKAVGIGRPAIWGLAVDGERGVTQILEILKREFDVAMALSGCARVSDISRDWIAE